MFDRYPKVSRPKDGTAITMRPPARDDLGEALAFAEAFLEVDRLFLRQDVSNVEPVRRWRKRNAARMIPLPMYHADSFVEQSFMRCMPY